MGIYLQVRRGGKEWEEYKQSPVHGAMNELFREQFQMVMDSDGDSHWMPVPAVQLERNLAAAVSGIHEMNGIWSLGERIDRELAVREFVRRAAEAEERTGQVMEVDIDV